MKHRAAILATGAIGAGYNIEISQIIAGRRAVSADTALRLARYFGTTPDLWMNLQKTYELDLARRHLSKTIRHIPQRASAAAPVSHRG